MLSQYQINFLNKHVIGKWSEENGLINVEGAITSSIALSAINIREKSESLVDSDG